MKLFLSSLGACLVLAMAAGQAAAAPTITAPSANGITVSPALEQITISPGQSSASYTIQVTNNTSGPVILQISAEDFTALNQNGGISFYGTNTLGLNNPHGLFNYLSIGYPEIALGPHQSQAVPISVLNANNLAVGGHYAALIFKLTGGGGGGGNKVIINQAVSSLVFLSTAGEGTQTTDLTTPLVGSLTTAFPTNLNAVFTNNGNTQTTVRGYAQILDSSSHVISQAQLNTGSSLTLPDSKRLFAISLTKQTNKRLLPGFYHLKIYYRHDGQAKYAVYQQRFLFISGDIIALVAVVIIILFFLALQRYLPKARYIAKK